MYNNNAATGYSETGSNQNLVLPRTEGGATAGFKRSETLFPELFDKDAQTYLIKRAMAIAGRMALMLEGWSVKRTYLAGPVDRAPLVLQVEKVRSGQDGVIRLYDTEANVREFPVDLVSFEFDEPARQIRCSGPDYEVLLEVVDL
jgi:hypothetical protein